MGSSSSPSFYAWQKLCVFFFLLQTLIIDSTIFSLTGGGEKKAMNPKIYFLITFLKIMEYFAQGSEQMEPSLSRKTHQKFSSKTRYDQRRNISFNAPVNCEPLHISMVLRHGSRYPSRNDVKKIDKMLNVVHDALLKSGIESTQIGELRLPWKNPFSPSNDKLLTSVGEEEMYNIAKRTLRRFPSLLSHPYAPQSFEFISTGTTRAAQSAMAFSFGLFEGRGHLAANRFQPVAILSRAVDNDPLLRFFDLCQKYLRRVAENKTAQYEYKNFKHGEEMRSVLEKVSSKLKIGHGVLSEEYVVGMYTACIFEVAIYERENTWCEIFDEEDLVVLDYLSDLKQYWKRGYGYPITYKSSCPLLERIITSLKNATEPLQEDQVYGSFMFAHGETLQPLYSLLGLFKDKEDLRADNFAKFRQRNYKTSYIAPFGANIAFVVYKCNTKDSASEQAEHFRSHLDSFMVQVFVNEELTAVPCCGKQTECPLETFLQCFNKEPCDLSALCSCESGTSKLHTEL